MAIVLTLYMFLDLKIILQNNVYGQDIFYDNFIIGFQYNNNNFTTSNTTYICTDIFCLKRAYSNSTKSLTTVYFDKTDPYSWSYRKKTFNTNIQYLIISSMVIFLGIIFIIDYLCCKKKKRKKRTYNNYSKYNI